MSTKDMTLEQFVLSQNIGKTKAITLDAFLLCGHSEESAASAEIFTIDLARKMEDGELPAIAATYAIRLGYKDVITQRREISAKPPKGFAPSAGFTHMSTISATDPDQESIVILVFSNETLASFTKQPM